MDKQCRVDDEKNSLEHIRSDRFIEKDDGFYIKTREGVDGPYPNLAAALNGLMNFALQSGMSRYQTRMLYESVCEKALSSVN